VPYHPVIKLKTKKMSIFDTLFGTKEKTDFKELMKRDALVIDVRSADEYRSGHLPGSVNIALEQVGTLISSLKQKNKPLIMVCRSGARSNIATGMLKKAGLEVYNGGAWDGLAKKIL
jgi:rhodanese-related sulfurtransferase